MGNTFRNLSLRNMTESSRVTFLFALEGVLLQFATSINGFSNNLYASNLGATDDELGLVQLIPNLLACILLLPLGILQDRSKSSKTVPLSILIATGIGYVLFGTVPAFGKAPMGLFFVFLAITVCGIAGYNAEWQAMFGSMVPIEERNSICVSRSRFMYVIGMVTPLICGAAMSMSAALPGKIMVQRVAYYLCGCTCFLQALVIYRLPGGGNGIRTENRFSLKDVGTAARETVHNKDFMLFFSAVLLFYMSWHTDYSMWYIGEVQYLNMSAGQLSIHSAAFSCVELLAIGRCSDIIRKRSPDFMMIITAGCMAICPLILAGCSFLPENMRFIVFTVLICLTNGSQAVITLSITQMLLRVLPAKNRAMAISLYTIVITLSNSLMPFLGVKLYTALGANHTGFLCFNAFLFLFRCTGTFALFARWRKIRDTLPVG